MSYNFYFRCSAGRAGDICLVGDHSENEVRMKVCRYKEPSVMITDLLKIQTAGI